jgi:uncharacterized membrane protein
MVHVAPMATTVLPPVTRDRIASIDIVRGAVMVLMAIDHVRVYAGVPAGGPSAGVFFTRWVTHFCAPAFVFFAGTGIYLYAARVRDIAAARRYVVTRGLLLVMLELTVIRFCWTFNAAYGTFVLAGVIWMLGWCMVLMGPLAGRNAAVVGWTGVAIAALQQVFGFVPHVLPAAVQQRAGWIWEFVYPAGYDAWPPPLAILYVIAPWFGVMAAGYGFGAIVRREPAARRRTCLRIGLTMIGLFAVYAIVMIVTAVRSQAGANGMPLVFRVLNPAKYPVSQAFLLMTLGPAITLLPLLERARGPIAGILDTFGRVPMFYYLLHIPAIHVAALAVNGLRGAGYHPEWYATAPYASVPPAAQWSLPLLYLTWAIVVALLYLPCRWFDRVKASRRDSWLRYL